MKISEALAISTGKDVKIAIIDSGIDSRILNQYPDTFIHPKNIIDQSENVTDVTGHGTMITCLMICDYKKNYIHGLSPDAKIIPIKIIDESGRTNAGNLSDAIYYAVDLHADIINISLGSRVYNEQVEIAIQYAYEKGVVVVAAGGDYQENLVIYPARFNETIAIQAQSKLGVKYIDASWGDEIDLMIPGEFVPVLSLDVSTQTLKLMTDSGSSVSAAIFSSIIALRMEIKDESFSELFNYIKDYQSPEVFLNVYQFITQ